MSKRRYSNMEANSFDEQSTSSTVGVNSDLKRLFVDSKMSFNVDGITDDDDCMPDDHASDEELNDYPVERNDSVEDDADVDQVPDGADDAPLTGNYMTKRLNELSLQQKFIAHDGTEWAKEPFQTSSHITSIESGGPTVKRINTRVNIFNLIFTQPMKNKIIRETNCKGHELAAFNRQWQEIDETELNAFLAVLLVMGVEKLNNEPLSELWTRQANCIYRATMTLDRFVNILTTIRFDDSNTREARQATDKAAPISQLWWMMNDNLIKNYEPYDKITVDEQLLPFRGRVPFKQCIPSEPAKYGVKIYWAVDAKSHYPLTGSIYLGQPAGAKRTCNTDENIVLQLVKPFENSGRNITTNNFYTTLALAEMLATRKLTLIGALRKDKWYIPKQLMWKTGDNIGTSIYAFRENYTMVAYTARHKKNLIILSSMHYNFACDDINGKPQILMEYNNTKDGVNKMVQKVTAYSCKRKTNRWPLAMFFNMVDVMTLAAHVIFMETHDKNFHTTRRVFITKLASELAEPHILRCSQDPMVTRIPGVLSAIEDMLDRKLIILLPEPAVVENNSSGRLKIQGKCHLCRPYQRNSRKRCMVCNTPVCKEHTLTKIKCISCQ